MSPGCLVLVDGWNHYLGAKRCFGYDLARKFPIDRLAAHLAEAVGANPVTEVVVVMALPDRNRPAEAAEFHAWRSKFKKLRNFGVRHEKARFSYLGGDCIHCRARLDRQVTCTACGTPNPLAGGRKEKGADVEVAIRAVDGARLQSYSTLILLSQDSDFAPMVRRVKEIHQAQRRPYALFSAFSVCQEQDHEHRSVPGTREIRIGEETYSSLAAKRHQNPLAEAGQAQRSAVNDVARALKRPPLATPEPLGSCP